MWTYRRNDKLGWRFTKPNIISSLFERHPPPFFFEEFMGFSRLLRICFHLKRKVSATTRKQIVITSGFTFI